MLDRKFGIAVGIASVCIASTASAAMPEDRGTYTVATWDAGMQSLDGTQIHVHVYYPSGMPGPFPILGVVHGASRTAANMAEMSNTFASRGFVVLAPDMPCAFTGCDHQANSRQLRAMLAWGVAQSAMSGTMLSGLVDGSKRGLAGHSWGALGSFLATDGDPDISAVVILDANDDSGVGAAAAPAVTQPSIHIMAEKPGTCNGTNWKQTVYPKTPAPHMRLVINGAAHCDVENPGDSLCPLVCGSGNPALNNMFRRYAVAWMSCIFQHDQTMGAWLGGTSFDADVAAMRVSLTDFAGLGALGCGANPSGDAGAGADASAGADSGGSDDDAGGGANNDTGSTGGCSAAPFSSGSPLLLLFVAAARALRSRSRRAR
jgi:dienelactone hydrolase